MKQIGYIAMRCEVTRLEKKDKRILKKLVTVIEGGSQTKKKETSTALFVRVGTSTPTPTPTQTDKTNSSKSTAGHRASTTLSWL